MRPTFREFMDLDCALGNAILDALPTLEDGRDLDYIARTLGKAT